MLVLGTLSALVGLGLLAGAAATGWANFQQRDGAYLTTPSERYETASYALISPGLTVMIDRDVPGVLTDGAGRLLLQGSAEAGREIFIGIAQQTDVVRYLESVRHSEVINVQFRPFRADYRDVPGSRAPAPPGQQDFWTATVQGAGTQRLEWDVEPGNWALVIMNADASSQVTVDLQAGFRSDLLWPVFLGLLISGMVLLMVGVPLIVAGAAGLGRHGPPLPYPAVQTHQPYGSPGVPYPAAAPQQTAGAPPATAADLPAPVTADKKPYPARLSGYLDPNLSRGMWLIKWFLAIPHVIVLLFLWFALVITTIVAGFAILFTGRYPRSLFDFNVGVLRWNWRVAFYAFTAIGTDRYPPFSLERTDYPADFDVDYPERLSRGLVLVKSWLLAIPHLLVLAALTGSGRTWDASQGGQADFGQTGSISLLGLLVLIAGTILLFTGRYWPGLFDLILGLNRWIYRVITYVALIRDEYPPFRLDQGPRDPGDEMPYQLPPSQPPAAARTSSDPPALANQTSAQGDNGP